MRHIWTLLGICAFVLGVIGLFLPLLPTTVFMIVAAACFARSSPRLHDWLVGHKVFGPAIQRWRAHGAIAPRAKRMALIAMAAAFGLSVVLGLALVLLAVQGAVLLGVAAWIWTRPDGPRG